MKRGKSRPQFSQDFASSWILNLGVVPLLRLSFFLLAPLFLVLLALRVLVTLVLETITHLSFEKNRYRPSYLPAKTPIVKIFLPTCLIFFIFPLSYGSAETILLVKGELKEFPLPPGAKFSLGQGEILSYKYFPKKNLLLLKGKKLGHSDLFIWDHWERSPKAKAKKYSLYVLAKNHHLRLVHLQALLKTLGLQADLVGPLVKGWGTVKTPEALLLLKQLEKRFANHLFLEADLSKALRNSLIGQIYYHLFQENVDRFRCYPLHLTLHCHYDLSTPPSPSTLKALESLYGVKWWGGSHPKNKSNFLVKMKLVQMEKLSGEEFRLGLHELVGTYEDLFTRGLDHLLRQQRFKLQKSHIRLSTLAEPEIVLTPNQPATLEMGSEIPQVMTLGKDEIKTTQWKFAGLHIKLLLTLRGNDLVLAYETEFTRPIEQSIVGQKGSSTLILRPGKTWELFEIGFKTNGQETLSFPFLGSLPLLGRLFQSTGTQSTYKKIYALIQIGEHTHDQASGEGKNPL